MLKKSIAFLAIAGLMVMGGCGQKPEVKPTAVEATPVKVTKVTTGDLASMIKVSGKVSAAMEVAVVPKIGGKVTEVRVDVGQRVKKGDLLVVLDDKDIQAQIKLSQAGLKVSQAGQQKSAIAYQEAKTNLERTRYLYQQGAVSQKMLEDVENAFARASAAYNPNAGNTESAAQIQQAKAQLESAQVNLGYTKIFAPIDGIIATRNIDPGEMSSPSTPVVTIVDTDEMQVEGNLAESEVNLVKIGDAVKVLVGAAGEQPFTGVVKSISPTVNSMSKAYPVKIEIANKNQLLKAGMMAELQLTAQAKKGIIIVPKEAILDRGNNKVVYVTKGDKAEERIVKLGLNTDTTVEITDGLKIGEQLVISGQQLLSNDAKVTIQDK